MLILLPKLLCQVELPWKLSSNRLDEAWRGTRKDEFERVLSNWELLFWLVKVKELWEKLISEIILLLSLLGSLLLLLLFVECLPCRPTSAWTRKEGWLLWRSFCCRDMAAAGEVPMDRTRLRVCWEEESSATVAIMLGSVEVEIVGVSWSWCISVITEDCVGIRAELFYSLLWQNGMERK